jgi:hypothetical protein
VQGTIPVSQICRKYHATMDKNINQCEKNYFLNSLLVRYVHHEMSIGGQANFFKVRKSQICRFLPKNYNSASKSKQSLESSFNSTVYYVKNFIRAFCTIFVRRKNTVCFCGLAKVLSPQTTLDIEAENRKSAKCHICGRSANPTDFRFTELICGPPNFEDE